MLRSIAHNGASNSKPDGAAVLTKRRDALFISYASEDAVFARWLTLKLTAEGYRVWCAEFELLGGESFPADVGNAIHDKTFRMIGLMSCWSVAKPNPTKERTIALKLAENRGQEFLIPLVLDDVNLDEQWMTSDLVAIDFTENWALGLSSLLAKLKKIDTPRPLNTGRSIAASTFLHDSFAVDAAETLQSNILPVTSIPKVIKKFRTSRRLDSQAKSVLLNRWPAYITEDDRTFRSFQTPPTKIVDEFGITQLGQGSLWRAMAKIDNIWTSNIVSNLLKKSLYCKGIECGLVWTKAHDYLYFPHGFAEKNKIHYTNYERKRTWLQSVGEQSFPGTGKFRYHLAPTFQIRQDFSEDFVVRLRNRVFISDLNEQPLETSLATPRRKRVCKSWWNRHWLLRQMAVLEFFSDGNGHIRIGDSEEQLVVSAVPQCFDVAQSLDDEAIKKFNQGLDPADHDDLVGNDETELGDE